MWRVTERKREGGGEEMPAAEEGCRGELYICFFIGWRRVVAAERAAREGGAGLNLRVTAECRTLAAAACDGLPISWAV
jgi:hypothetical protein